MRQHAFPLPLLGVFVVALTFAVGALGCGLLVGLEKYEAVDCPPRSECPQAPNVGDGGAVLLDGSSIIDGGGGGLDGQLIGDGASPGVDAGPSNPIYVASKRSLFRFDVATKQVTLLYDVGKCDGDFDALAMRSNGSFLVGTGGFYPAFAEIVVGNGDAGNAECADIVKGNYHMALTFIPQGVLDPTTEVLAGYDNADYVSVLVSGGTVSDITPNALMNRKPRDLAAHGDVGYLSAESNGGGGECGVGDCLVQVDLKTGNFVATLGSFPEKDIPGIAYVGGFVYGFARSGRIFVVVPSPFAVIDMIIPPVQREWGPATSALE